MAIEMYYVLRMASITIVKSFPVNKFNKIIIIKWIIGISILCFFFL